MDEPRLYAGWGKNHTYVVAVGSSAAWLKSALACSSSCGHPPLQLSPRSLPTFPPFVPRDADAA